jgi:hypothetical protein
MKTEQRKKGRAELREALAKIIDAQIKLRSRVFALETELETLRKENARTR